MLRDIKFLQVGQAGQGVQIADLQLQVGIEAQI